MAKVKNRKIEPNIPLNPVKTSWYLTITRFILDEVSHSQIFVLISYLIAISILELLAYSFQGIFTIIASRIWLIGGAICFAAIFYYFFIAIKKDLISKNYISIISIILLIIALICVIGNVNITEINPDATQQASAGIDSFKTVDWNYTGKAFLGYPNRQYILSAIPAVVLGRSIFSLQLGFGYPFLLGIICLYLGIRKWAEKVGGETRLSIIPIFAILVFPFITEYYLNFEQAIYPVSFTMIVSGFFLVFICERNILNLFAISWFGCLLSNSYTPALASLGLLILFIIITSYVLYRKPDLLPFKINNNLIISKVLGITGINIIVFLIATLVNQRQDRITQIRQDTGIISSAYNSIFSFITDKDAVFMGMFGFVVLIYLIAGISLKLNKKDFVISIWVFGVFTVTFLLKGYTAYQPAWIMQRALIVIPVILIGIIMYLIDWINKYKIKVRTDFIVIILIVCSIIAYSNFQRINQSFTYFNSIQPMKYMLSDLEKTTKEMNMTPLDTFNLIVYADDILRKNPGDYCKFLYPNAKVYVPNKKEMPNDIDLSKNTFIYSDTNIAGLINKSELKRISFENKKHKNTVTLFKGIINK